MSDTAALGSAADVGRALGRPTDTVRRWQRAGLLDPWADRCGECGTVRGYDLARLADEFEPPKMGRPRKDP